MIILNTKIWETFKGKSNNSVIENTSVSIIECNKKKKKNRTVLEEMSAKETLKELSHLLKILLNVR